MAFKVRDLMIDLVPTANCGITNLIHCRYPTAPRCVAYTYCGYTMTPVEFLQGCGISERPTGPGPVDLGSLKEQLRAQLAEIETQERAAEAAARPQTREQAAELEEKLQGALEEIQSLKRTLPSRD
jgi:hypothetical protein